MAGEKQTIPTGTYLFEAPCPRCGVIELLLASVRSVHTLGEDEIGSLRLRLRTKAVDHDCRQIRITVSEQTELEEAPE